MARSLLPFNRTPLERDIELAFADRLDSIPHLIRSTDNADTIPSVLLPWLAWAWRVEVWNDNWTDQQKRQAIKSSYRVHQKAGTVSAIKTALGSLGVSVELKEWFEDKQNRKPYTFWNVIDPGDNPLTREFWFDLLEVVNRTKNVRSHMGVNEVIRKMEIQSYNGAITTSRRKVSLQPYRWASSFWGAVSYIERSTTIKAKPKQANAFWGSVFSYSKEITVIPPTLFAQGQAGSSSALTYSKQVTVPYGVMNKAHSYSASTTSYSQSIAIH